MRLKLEVPIAWLVLTLPAVVGVSIVQAQEGPPYPPPGRLVDIGGWRLHIDCRGESKPGEPTVILEAGIGDFSSEWSLVQPGVARFARVCSYDRADEGWSDIGPHPRTFQQLVYELHTLLKAADVRPPYLLVAHSYGAWVVRFYRMKYPAEIEGMVLIEGGVDNPYRMLADGRLHRSSDDETGSPIPPAQTSNPTRESDVPSAAMGQIMAAARQLAPRANEPPRDRLPIEAQRMRTWVYSQPKHWMQCCSKIEADELALLRRERLSAQFPYGALPLTVIARGMDDADGQDGKALGKEHREELTAISRLSSSGTLVVAERSHHHVQIEQPDLVIESIRVMMTSRKPH